MSKKDIRPQGAEGISHPRNVAKQSLTVNDSSMTRLLPAADIANGADCRREQFQDLAAPFPSAIGGAQ